ncbi:hypothetical protein M9458_036596, partial [Cirrhinus mrigala]
MLQVYQADLLKELDEGKEIKESDISELRRTVYGSPYGHRETSLVDPVRHEREGQGLPPGRPAVAFWTAEGSPIWGEAGRTALFGVRFFSVPSGGRSANPAGASGRSGLLRAFASVSSARRRSGAGELTTPKGVSGAASTGASCRETVIGHRTSGSNNTRGQSRETGSLSRSFGIVETTAQCVCMGPVYCRARLSHSVRRSSSAVQWGFSHSGWPRVGGKAYQYRVLPFSLALSPRTFTKCVDAALAPLRLQGIRIINYINDWLILAQMEQVAVQHRDVVLTHMKELGLRLNAKKSMLSPLQRTTYLAVVWDSTTMQARLSPARIESILTAVVCIQRDTFWSAVHETPTVVAQDQGVVPERKPAPHDQDHTAMPTCSRHVEETLVLVSGPGAGSSLLPRNASDGRVPHRLGSGHGPRGGEADLESIWPGSGGLLRDSGECAMSPLVLSDHGTDVARLRLYAFPPIALLPGALERVRRDGVSLLLVAPFWPGRVWFSGLISLLDGSPWEIPVRKDLLSQAGGSILHPRAGAVEALGVASEGAHLLAFGLSTKVVETILQSRAPSTRKLYALKWRLFTSWCGHHLQDLVSCPVGTVLEFLQDRFSAGLTHSTLKVYVAAISAYHAPLGGLSVGKNPLITRFLRGALRLRPPARPCVPSWDLSVVLEALCRPPFEPIEDISDHHLTIKTVLLLALSSLKRVGDLQALSVAPSFLDFAPGLAKAFLYPNSGYVPKVPSSTPRPVVLQAFYPPPFREPDQQKLNCMSPVRAHSCSVEEVRSAF